jgi:hypothetical protein
MRGGEGKCERRHEHRLNPLQSLTDRAADAIYWKDSRAGHVPYGRGFMYLAAVDAEIRAHTHNKGATRMLPTHPESSAATRRTSARVR